MPSTFSPWHEHFLHNKGPDHCLRLLPWDDPYHLSDWERNLITKSIQQFQLGEFARGDGIRRRAASSSISKDPDFLAALDLFIKEEQDHSEILGCFLDREGIPKLRHHWLDAVFRRLRKLAGLEMCSVVLITAEVLAIPYYQALRDATRSNLLRAIARRILYDEVSHLRFQAQTIGILRRRHCRLVQDLGRWLHSTLFAGTALLLWSQHARLFRAAGWDFSRYWKNACREFGQLNAEILDSCWWERPAATTRLRLD
jgi:hypothetical protein